MLRCRPLLAVADHLFTARDLRLREDPAEWAHVADRVGVPAARLLLIRQVHRNDVAIARRDRTGDWVRPEADVIVSDDPTSAIGVRQAHRFGREVQRLRRKASVFFEIEVVEDVEHEYEARAAGAGRRHAVDVVAAIAAADRLTLDGLKLRKVVLGD